MLTRRSVVTAARATAWAVSNRKLSESDRRSDTIFPIGQLRGYLNLKAYAEFDGLNRPSGWNTWLTFSLSPGPPTNPRSAMLTK